MQVYYNQFYEIYVNLIIGYGPQEQFYGCSDISIKSRNGQVIVDSTTATAAATTRPQNTVSQQIISTTATSKPNGNGKCLNGDGLYANPGCKTFYQCSFSGTASQQVHNFDCPNGLLFDNSAKVCNWPSLVNCKN